MQLIDNIRIFCVLQDLFCLTKCEDIWAIKYNANNDEDSEQHKIICRNHPDTIVYYSQLISLFLEIIEFLPHIVNTILHNGQHLAEMILKTVDTCAADYDGGQCEEINMFRIKCIKFICKLNAITDVSINLSLLLLL